MSVFIKEERDDNGCCYDLEMILPEPTGDLGGGGGGGPEWLLPASPLLFQDRMMSGCDAVTGEHSYSSQQDTTVGSQGTDDTTHQFVLPDIKMEEEDLDSDIFSAVPVATVTGQTELRPKEIKEEMTGGTSPQVEPPVNTAAPVGRIMSASSIKRKGITRTSSTLVHTISKPALSSSSPTNIETSILGVGAPNDLDAHPSSSSSPVLNGVVAIPNSAAPPTSSSSSCQIAGASTGTIGSLRVKVEPGLNCLPPSPPSSVSNDSESDEGLCSHATSDSATSTHQSSASSKCKKQHTSGTSSSQLTSRLISSQNGGSRSGTLHLTEEEKRTLIAEGYPVPTRLPLSKAEERSLKKIRRKIKNKISAQESRRKKKEYMDALEKRVEILTAQQREMLSSYERLEQTNRDLVEQLRVLQSTLDGGVTTEENVEEIINITDIPTQG